MKAKLPEQHLLRMALKKVAPGKKEALTKKVCELVGDSEKKRVLQGVKPTLEECLKILDVTKQDHA
jgi:hypothetical protein